MKRYILLMCVWLILTACKTRKVANTRKDSVGVNTSTSASDIVKKGIDTSKVVMLTTVSEITSIKSVDSSGTFTEIKPVAGTISIVDANGTFHGQAESIKTMRHGVTTANKQQVVNNQQSTSEAKGIDTTVSKHELTTSKDSTALNIDTHNVDAKASSNWVLWLIVAGIALAAGFVVYRNIKPG